jgi:hypothetical protein
MVIAVDFDNARHNPISNERTAWTLNTDCV